MTEVNTPYITTDDQISPSEYEERHRIRYFYVHPNGMEWFPVLRTEMR
jgi:hypothetical protein